jgi:hypothetical protein
MSSIDRKIVDAILARIRTLRSAPSRSEEGSQADSTATGAPVKLREVDFSDHAAVVDLKRRFGLTPDVFENWERLWRSNPALENLQTPRPMGWVLEADGRVVGFLGNISLVYRYGDRNLSAVTANGLVVEPAYRAVSLSLIAAFYRQKSVDLFLTTTAIEAVGKIARAFKSDPLPQPDYDTIFFWVLQPHPFAQSVMKKLQIDATWLKIGAVIGSLAVSLDKVVRRRWPRRSRSSLTVRRITTAEIADEFQSLWLAKLKERTRLFADRSASSLRWHFTIPGDKGTTHFLCCYEGRELLGYAAVRTEFNPETGLKRALIADLIARQDDPKVLSILLHASYQQAKQAGSHILEAIGFPQEIRQLCSQWNPYERRLPACPFYYKATDKVLHSTLADGSAWYASPFDGDTTLIP